ncbi:hypothetical protein PV326_013536, partial [Microctonus aethiopoides]
SGLKIVTSTDRKCLWSAPRDSCLEQYDAKLSSEHSCFKIKMDHLELDKNVKKLIKEKLYSGHLKSSLSEHAYGPGRHSPLLHIVENLLPEYLRQIECLISHLSSSPILSTLCEHTLRPPRECFQKTYEQLMGDPFHICKETKKFYSIMQDERNTVFNAALNHGLKFESAARIAYEKTTGVNVFQCRLLVPKNNPWLGYSPDGVLFEDNKPVKLIEIKCSYDGSTWDGDFEC